MYSYCNAFWRLTALSGSALFLSGCMTPLWDLQGTTPDLEDTVEKVDAEEAVEPRTVGEFTIPVNLGWTKVESISLAAGLKGTGSDPAPSPQRAQLVQEMLARDTHQPERKLASPDTSMVIAVAHLPPGVEKGDMVDVLVTTRGRSETTSLENGFLMLSRMRPTEVLGNAVRTGSVSALGQGKIITDATFDGDADPVRLKRGRILAGARSGISRPLGLRVRNQFKSMSATTVVSSAINYRFHFSDPKSGKRGVANPKTDNFIELFVPPNYRTNKGRYLRVVAHVAVNESPGDKIDRLSRLRLELLDPATSEKSALALEAIGKNSEGALTAALDSANNEVRFFAAEALAYLDNELAISHLEKTAAEEPFYRWRALTAIAQMNHLDAGEALANLLHSSSAETRYGAFTALREHSPGDPLVRGKTLGQEFYLHIVPTTGDSMVHVSRYRRPEVVVFDNGCRLQNLDFLMEKNLIIKADGPGQVRISRFETGRDDRRIVCSDRVADIVEGIVEVGGGYADVYRILNQAHDKNNLGARLEVNALPEPKGVKRTEEIHPAESGSPSEADWTFNLFAADEADDIADDEMNEEESDSEANAEEPEPKPGFFGRMTSWLTN